MALRLRTLWTGALLAGLVSVASADDAVQLFNGSNLEGWTQRGGKAKYSVDGDTIVGTTVPSTPNSFLCTNETYGDFVLELDFKVDEGLNSGIQIRSECYDEDTKVDIKQRNGKVKETTFPAGRVHGYQVEIDASPRSWSGGIYDEARRGWLDDLSSDEDKAGREAFKPGEWNHYRIEAKGSSLQVWLNGVQTANVTDDVTPKGFIALQVHSIGGKQDAGKHIRWKNIALTKLDEASE